MQAAASGAHGSATIARTMASVGRPNTVLVRFSKSVPVAEMVDRLRSQPGVLSVQPNRMGRAPLVSPAFPSPARPAFRAGDGETTLDPAQAADPRAAAAAAAGAGGAPFFPSDPDWTLQPALPWMDNQFVFPDRAPSPMVAVVATGVDATHPDLVGKIVKGTDWVNGDKDPDDDNGEGTIMAGQIAALINNGKGITGLSNGKVFAVKVQDAESWWTEFDVAAGILEAANNALVRVITLGPMGGPWKSSLIRGAIQTAVDKGKLLVLRAGDDNTSAPQYPAYYAHSSFPTLSPAVISVAATGANAWEGCPGPGCTFYVDYNCRTNNNGYGSNYGDWISVMAPGTNVRSTTPTHPTFSSGLPRTYGWGGHGHCGGRGGGGGGPRL